MLVVLVLKSVLRPSCTIDNVGVYINVSCGSASGQLYLDRLSESKQSLAKCILVGGAWYTPPEFESFGGKRAKKWKKSLQHLGKPLGDFNLSCPPRQGVQHGLNIAGPDGSSLSQPTQYVATSEHNTDNTSVVEGMLPGLAARPCAVTSSCPLLINTVLSFIKAYRLRGDTESLKRVINEHFSTSEVETAKQLFGQFTKHDLELAGLSFHFTP